jgi:glyoxylase-like metal-dependent hydrolase (beta-lactamase superfamily II)
MSPPVGSQSISCRLVSDGAGTYPTGIVFPGVDADTLRSAGIGDTVTTPYHAVLATVEGRRILVDAGLGERAAQMGGTAGRLVDELRAMGVEPGDVDDVIMSHAHADHVGGLVTAGEPTFARARHHLPRAEHDFWRGPNPQERLFPALADALITTARATIEVLDDAGLLELCASDAEPMPGVRLIDAPGHTPGHVAVEIDATDGPFLYAADTSSTSCSSSTRSGPRRSTPMPTTRWPPAIACSPTRWSAGRSSRRSTSAARAAWSGRRAAATASRRTPERRAPRRRITPLREADPSAGRPRSSG